MKKLDIKIMQTIDETLLQQLDKVKELPFYQKVLDTYNLLEEWEQSIANFILMAITILVPIIITLIFYGFYLSEKNVSISNDKIIVSASKIIAKSSQIRSQSSRIFGQPITNENTLKNKVGNLLSATGIDSSKIKIDNFDLQEMAGINEINARISFNGFSSQNFYGFIQKMMVTEKYKVKEINIEKNPNSKLLEGSFEVSYFSKAIVETDE